MIFKTVSHSFGQISFQRPLPEALKKGIVHHSKNPLPGGLRVASQNDPILKKPAKPVMPKEIKEDLSISQPQSTVEAAMPALKVTEEINSNDEKVLLEFQRTQAKAMKNHFDSLTQQTIANTKFFGWTKENEIINGRWVMFGILVGLLTEYATGVSMVDQIKLMITYLGIADLTD